MEISCGLMDITQGKDKATSSVKNRGKTYSLPRGCLGWDACVQVIKREVPRIVGSDHGHGGDCGTIPQRDNAVFFQFCEEDRNARIALYLHHGLERIQGNE